MLRIFLSLALLSSCSLGTIKTGGDGVYTYNHEHDYTLSELKELAPKVIETSRREPPVGKLDDLFGMGQRPIKRFTILIFESSIQSTRGGLATEDEIFLAPSGKQILTEGLLKVWEESLSTLAEGLEYVPMSKIKKSKSYPQFGMNEDDHVKAKRTVLAPDDIFFLEKGKKSTTTTIVNPRGTRDMSLAYVPAYELMGGPKWSEQHKIFVNDVMKELKLDMVLIVYSEINWTKGRTDKHSGELISEEIKLKLKSSALTSLSEYRDRAERLGFKDVASINLCFRTYEEVVKVPVNLNFENSEKSFEVIQKIILNPALSTYKDMTIMMVDQLTQDMRKTF